MILPTIHSNGTGAQDLLDGYSNAYLKVQDAIAAVKQVEFNARDYYVQPEPAWDEARKARMKCFMDLDRISQEMMAHAEVASDAITAKAARLADGNRL